MNASIKDSSHPSIVYYDSDYPSKYFPVYSENFDEIVSQQGIADDVEKYKQLTKRYGKNVLELCCGTGRVSIPLVMDGCRVTAIDSNAPLLKRFKNKLSDSIDFPTQNLEILKKDVTTLSLDQTNFDVVVCAFNSLLCIPDFKLQQETILRAAEHLRPNGLFALDIANPLAINLLGDKIPEYYFTRKRTDNGNSYVRYAATGPMNINQVQPVYGWYDETLTKGIVTRVPYSLEWRIIFRYELALMLEKAGLEIIHVYGGNQNEPLQTTSSKMFVEAIKVGRA
jgi:ubiquinone/menaquinone biosynthesis C-methylase UbiE